MTDSGSEGLGFESQRGHFFLNFFLKIIYKREKYIEKVWFFRFIHYLCSDLSTNIFFGQNKKNLFRRNRRYDVQRFVHKLFP